MESAEFECSVCGADISADDNVCPKCGNDVSEIEDDDSEAQQTRPNVPLENSEGEPYECGECGSDVSATDNFCRKCGNDVSELEEENLTVEAEEEFDEEEEGYYLKEAEGDPVLAKRMEDSDIFNMGVHAHEDGNQWEAMHHFNRCMERDPESLLKFLCLYNLGASIEHQFNFYQKGGGETGTDEEVAWSIRRGICGEQAAKVFDVESLSDDNMDGLQDLYHQAREMCNTAFTWGAAHRLPSGELQERDWSAVRRSELEMELQAIRPFEDDYWSKGPEQRLFDAQEAVDAGQYLAGIGLFERVISRPGNPGYQYMAAYGAVEAYAKLIESRSTSAVTSGTTDNKKLHLFIDLVIDIFPEMTSEIQKKLPIGLVIKLKNAIGS